MSDGCFFSTALVAPWSQHDAGSQSLCPEQEDHWQPQATRLFLGRDHRLWFFGSVRLRFILELGVLTKQRRFSSSDKSFNKSETICSSNRTVSVPDSAPSSEPTMSASSSGLKSSAASRRSLSSARHSSNACLTSSMCVSFISILAK